MSFKRDLEIGKAGEKLARKKTEELGYNTGNGDGKEVDFYIVDTSESEVIKCEVKYDIYEQKSGNLAIEFFNSKIGKDSGISASKCDLWIHVLSDNIYFSLVKNLRSWINENKPLRTVYGKGDSNSDMHLYTRESICGKGLLELNHENLEKAINEILS